MSWTLQTYELDSLDTGVRAGLCRHACKLDSADTGLRAGPTKTCVRAGSGAGPAVSRAHCLKDFPACLQLLPRPWVQLSGQAEDTAGVPGRFLMPDLPPHTHTAPARMVKGSFPLYSCVLETQRT